MSYFLSREFRNGNINACPMTSSPCDFLQETDIPPCLHGVEKGRLPFRPLKDTIGKEILLTINMTLIANISFIPPLRAQIEERIGAYGVDTKDFCTRFDGATFRLFPELLNVKVAIYEDCYNFGLGRPRWPGVFVGRNIKEHLFHKRVKIWS